MRTRGGGGGEGGQGVLKAMREVVVAPIAIESGCESKLLLSGGGGS